MRTRHVMLSASILLGAAAASAQTPPPVQAPAAPAPMPFTGTFDVGGLFTGADGDEARYERYRDTRDGLYSGISLRREDTSYLLDASASHIGYRDQRYHARLMGRAVNVGFNWVSVPLNYSYIVRTPFTTGGGTLTLDDAAQRAVQGPTFAANDGTAVGVPCAPGAPPAACGNPAQAGQAKANRSIYNNLATTFDLRHVRDTAAFDVRYAASRDVDIDASVTSAARSGQQPFGASFAFNN